MTAHGVLAATLVEPGKYELREYPLPEPAQGRERIRKVVDLLATMKAAFLVMADDQSPERNRFSGRVYDKACPKLTAQQWKHVGNIVADAEKAAQEFGLELVFYPHVATYVETPEECELFFDATPRTTIGLCLDTGHCVYGHRFRKRSGNVQEQAAFRAHQGLQFESS
jgi:sugar phosphate isomerase/epimerase